MAPGVSVFKSLCFDSTPMSHILLRSRTKPSRFIGRRGWVASEKRAKRFSNAQEAMFHCVEHDIEDVEIFVRFADPHASPVVINFPQPFVPAAASADDWINDESEFAYA